MVLLQNVDLGILPCEITGTQAQEWGNTLMLQCEGKKT